MAQIRAIGRINGVLSEISDLLADSYNGVYITVGAHDTDPFNMFIGGKQQPNVHTGTSVVALGYSALQVADTVDNSVAIGTFAGTALVSGYENIFIGQEVASFGTYLTRNIAIGSYSLQFAEGTVESVAVGYQAGVNVFGSSRNVFLGAYAGFNHDDSNDKLWIGNVQFGTGSNLITGDFANGKVGINVDAHSIKFSALFQINGTNGFMYGPRLSTAERDAVTPEEGAEVYNTTTHKKQYYSGTAWVDVGGGAIGSDYDVDGGTFSSVYGGTEPLDGGSF